MAAPIPAPTIAISEIGVLRTRSAPNSSSSPWVTPIEPPISAMSSPMMKTSSSSRIARASVSRTASRYESSGIDVLHGVLRRGIGAVLRDLDRLLDDSLYVGVHRRVLVLRDRKAFPQLDDWVVLLVDVANLFFRPVHLRLADVVPVEAICLDVEENGALAAAHVIERLARLRVHLLGVLAVDFDRAHVVGERALRHVVPDGRVLPAGSGLRPAVVLADEERLRPPELCEVERLVERSDVRRAVAEERDCDARLVAKLEREARAADRRQPPTDA